MLINNAWGNDSGGGGGNITINGSTNSIVDSIIEMNNLSSPKNGDIAHVTITKELYMYKDGTWTIIPTGDMFYNKLASLNNTGHVQLTSDITSISEDLAVTPKALNEAIEAVKVLINAQQETEWDDLSDGMDETTSSHEWDSWGDGVDETPTDELWEDW